MFLEDLHVLRKRMLPALGLLMVFAFATAMAQDKKDAPKDTPKEVKKDEPKKEETKKEEAKKEEAKKEEVKKEKEAPKKEEAKKEEVKTPDPKKEETAKKEEVKKEEAPGLAWKFTVNVPFYQKMTTITEQNIKVMGLDVTQKQDQTFYFKWTPVKQDGDKWEIKQEIEGIQMKIDIAGNPVSFDSTQENAAGGSNTALSEFFKALKGSAFTLTLNTKTQKVENVVGKEDFLKKLATANQQLEPLLKKILSDDALKQMADPTFGILPPTAKKVDETWDATSTLNLGPIGTYTNGYKYTFKGADKTNADLDLINVATTLKYAAPTEVDPALPFKIKSSNLVTKDNQEPGKILFNRKLGRLESSDVKLALSGTLTIEIGGNTTQVELTQTQDTKVLTGAESYLPKAEPKKGP